MSYLIVVCETANSRCPHSWPGSEIQKRLFWPFEDPVAAQGNEEERLGKFRQVRDQIEQQIKSWVKAISEHEDEQNRRQTATAAEDSVSVHP